GRYPRAAGRALAVTEALIDGPREVAVVGPPGDPATAALRRTALHATAPGAVLAVGPALTEADGASTAEASPDTAKDVRRPAPETLHGPAGETVALLAGRGTLGGAATAYVCRGFVCDRPTTDPAELAAQLSA